jgi:hypothetical protein
MQPRGRMTFKYVLYKDKPDTIVSALTKAGFVCPSDRDSFTEGISYLITMNQFEKAEFRTVSKLGIATVSF